MFNTVEEIYNIIINIIKDKDCNVALGKQNYNYYIEIRWHQQGKSRVYRKVFSELMIINSKYTDINDFLINEIFKEVKYAVGKIAYEED